MNKVTLSVLLTAMMATAGFASAQSTPTLETAPAKTRTEVKGEVTKDNTYGDQTSSKANAANAPTRATDTTRAAVKSDTTGKSGPGDQSESGVKPGTKASDNNPGVANSRADVKAADKNAATPGTLSTLGTANGDLNKPTATSSTAEERQARRAKRKAMKKPKPMMDAPASDTMKTPG